MQRRRCQAASDVTDGSARNAMTSESAEGTCTLQPRWSARTESAVEAGGMESNELEQDSARSWLLRAPETERGAVEVYLAAMRASSSPREHDEWRTLLDHARKHEQMLTRACRTLGIDPDEPTAGRDMIGSLAASLVESIE